MCSCHLRETIAALEGPPVLQAFESPGLWLKGNLHTHTTNSDGRHTPEERLAGYRQRGYDFLCFTDHNYVTRAADAELIAIAGCEVQVPARGGGGATPRAYHVVALDVPPVFHLMDGLAIQEAVDEVLSVGGLPIIAHPYWSGLSLADLQDVRGALGIEIYNYNCAVGIAKGLSTVHWDDLLAAGWRGNGFAVDDAHFLSDAYGGWIMVKSPCRETEAILEAIRAGRFYSSTGPEIRSVRREADKLAVECSDAVAINLIGRNSAGQRLAAPGVDQESAGGAAVDSRLNSASFSFGGMTGYARIEVVDSLGRSAWTNPLYL